MGMETLVPDPPPPDFAAPLEGRKESGADRLDEVWDGVLVLMPSPGRGTPSA